MPRVLKREAAKRDLTQHFIYLAEQLDMSPATLKMAIGVHLCLSVANSVLKGIRLARTRY
jgi:hypothetical protein